MVVARRVRATLYSLLGTRIGPVWADVDEQVLTGTLVFRLLLAHKGIGPSKGWLIEADGKRYRIEAEVTEPGKVDPAYLCQEIEIG